MPFELNPIFIGGGRFLATILSFDCPSGLSPVLGLKLELALIEPVPTIPVLAEAGGFFSVLAAVRGRGASYYVRVLILLLPVASLWVLLAIGIGGLPPFSYTPDTV